jgi:hypothetical protein
VIAWEWRHLCDHSHSALH